MGQIIEDIVRRILEENKEVNLSENDFMRGKRLAYYEVLDMIYNRLTIQGYDPADFGLPQDPFIILHSD